LKFIFKNLFSNSRGITLVEIVVVIFIIALFSSIIILNFPKIQGSFALTSAAYELAGDIGSMENIALSGVTPTGATGATGYGVYINKSNASYIKYADTCPTASPNKYYTTNNNCGLNGIGGNGDFVIGGNVVNIDKNNPGVYIQTIKDNLGVTTIGDTSINFTPPNPKIDLDNTDGNEIDIVLSLTSDTTQTKTVIVNTSGLITVQ
jgi:Tfp pilus assembly protein FimT